MNKWHKKRNLKGYVGGFIFLFEDLIIINCALQFIIIRIIEIPSNMILEVIDKLSFIHYSPIKGEYVNISLSNLDLNF